MLVDVDWVSVSMTNVSFVAPFDLFFLQTGVLQLNFLVRSSYLSFTRASSLSAYICCCLFAIEFSECEACYYESLGFADHRQGK